MCFTHHSRHPILPKVEAWNASRGFWSFLILHDKEPDAPFYTSYRDQRDPVGLTAATAQSIMFFGDDELKHVAKVPPEFGHRRVDDAMRACEAKYRSLLTR